jgi:EF-P beta-lysylation protein EpmB
MFEANQTAQTIDAIRPTPEPNWRQELALAFKKAPDLLRALELDPGSMAAPEEVLRKFPLRVPRGYVARMKKGDRTDPLLLQVLPVTAEGRVVAGFSADPVGDLASVQGNGILQKYRGRALLIATGACAVHCRYCFRREFPYQESSATAGSLDAAIETLSADDSIREIILSGGDPLSLSNERLETLLLALSEIPHLKRVRVHTRLPVVLPERVDAGLLALLSGFPKPVVFVLHCNHANEIDTTMAEAAARLADNVYMLLNQSVLLRGVNDSPEALVSLSEKLFDIGVLPYYLHQLDPVRGAAHFEVDDRRARKLIRSAAAILPGFLVPKLVREVPGAPAKELVA